MINANELPGRMVVVADDRGDETCGQVEDVVSTPFGALVRLVGERDAWPLAMVVFVAPKEESK